MATKPEPKKTENKKPEPKKDGKKEKMSEKFVYTDKDNLVITDKNGKVMDFGKGKKDQKTKK